MQHTLEQADAQTNQGQDRKQQQDRSINDSRTDLANPADSRGKDRTNVAHDAGNSSGSSSSAQPPFSINQYLDCLANETKANKTNQIENRWSQKERCKLREELLRKCNHIIHSSKAPPPFSESYTIRSKTKPRRRAIANPCRQRREQFP